MLPGTHYDFMAGVYAVAVYTSVQTGVSPHGADTPTADHNNQFSHIPAKKADLTSGPCVTQ